MMQMVFANHDYKMLHVRLKNPSLHLNTRKTSYDGILFKFKNKYGNVIWRLNTQKSSYKQKKT